MLPDHLLGVLRQQHPSVVIESIELLGIPKCHLDGMMEEGSTIMRVQTLDVPLDLRVAVRVGSAHLALDIQLVLKFEGLDSNRTVRSDMLIKAQTQMD